ncbi:MAG: hypothetical protein ACRC67_44105 [Inquilinus sp.]|uniref:hypothetical protein n=1 Tax=Inquilinus sp. TaxID=1932117 RepID=UPI003F33A697
MPSPDPRIEGLFRADRRGATAFVVLLWAAMLFVFIAMWPLVDGPVRLLLAVAGGAVLILNTASIWALVKHYAEDKEAIYGLDLRHLDAARGQDPDRFSGSEAHVPPTVPSA